jgi:hypothetical protein
MDKVMLAIKYLEFLALELAVFGVMGTVLIAGLYQIVRDKVRESRRRDQVAQAAYNLSENRRVARFARCRPQPRRMAATGFQAIWGS